MERIIMIVWYNIYVLWIVTKLYGIKKWNEDQLTKKPKQLQNNRGDKFYIMVLC